MHIYIFDQYLNQKKYERAVARIETRLTDLGLNGKNCHVGPLKSLRSIIVDELKNSPKTIVAVGNNGTLNQVINSIGNSDAAVGIIPVGGDNSIAETFGIKDEDQACKVLSARLMEKIDLGKINDQYFLSTAQISNKETILEINGKYTVEPAGPGKVEIINLDTKNNGASNPKDGRLEIFIIVTKKRVISSETDRSFIRTNRAIINNLLHENFIIDDLIKIKTPVEIGVVKNKLRIIVGKERKF